jgi:2-polyprenyl-3-methyl-5-hydroxy-6-metoxy-1,4-benzoquinol methylase
MGDAERASRRFPDDGQGKPEPGEARAAGDSWLAVVGEADEATGGMYGRYRIIDGGQPVQDEETRVRGLHPKEFLKRQLGETRLWSFMQKTRHHARRLKNTHTLLITRKRLYQRLQSPGFYDEAYFDTPKDPNKASGYQEVYADSGEFREVAELSRKLFQPAMVLDVGCAKGFQVGALRSLGIQAWGIDISEYAVKAAPPEVSPWLRVESCTGMAFPDESFDLLLALETMEHIPPADIERTIRELYRVGRKWLWASVPCMGGNRYGLDGIVEGKINEDHLDLYHDKVIDHAPLKHLILDINGYPIHGHITIASFDWWTAAFNEGGFIRRGDLERVVNEKFPSAHVGLRNCMVFEKAAYGAGAESIGEGREWLFKRGVAGTWETEPLFIPAGIHYVEVRVAVAGMLKSGEPLHRALHCEGFSAGGDRINSSLVLSLQNVQRMNRNGRLDLSLVCCSGGEEICFRLTFMPELKAAPLYIATGRRYKLAG